MNEKHRKIEEILTYDLDELEKFIYEVEMDIVGIETDIEYWKLVESKGGELDLKWYRDAKYALGCKIIQKKAANNEISKRLKAIKDKKDAALKIERSKKDE